MKRKVLLSFFCCLFAILFTACEHSQSIVNDIEEREANEIVVYLASKNIRASKVTGGGSDIRGGSANTNKWNIQVDSNKTVEAMAFLNQVGLPRRKGTSLLELFAKSGLMSSEKEETIRYQAGLEEQLKDTIRKIDGVIDADVNISFPKAESAGILGTEVKQKVTAAVFVKHQGVMDDPNNHFETKIKRLLAGSIQDLDFENVSVITDRARFADITLDSNAELISARKKQNDYVSIWSIRMTKESLARFRTIFFVFICLILLFGSLLGWIAYKGFPELQKKGLFNWNLPFMKKPETKQPSPPPEKGPEQ